MQVKYVKEFTLIKINWDVFSFTIDFFGTGSRSLFYLFISKGCNTIHLFYREFNF